MTSTNLPTNPKTGQPYANEPQYVWDTLQNLSENEQKIMNYFKGQSFLFKGTAQLLGYSPIVLKRLVKKGVLRESSPLQDGYLPTPLFQSHFR